MARLRIAIIGYGYWGPNLVRNFRQVPGCEVVAVADTNVERLRQCKADYPGLPTVTKADELLYRDDVDAVVVATPPHTHHHLVKAALERGKHVLVEKPMSLNISEAEDLVELAQVRGQVLMSGYTFLYASSVRCIKNLVCAGQLGDLWYFDSVRVNLGIFRPDVNVVWDLAAHDISIFQYLVGRCPERVSVIADDHIGHGLESIAYIALEYSPHVMAHIHVSWLSPLKIRRMLIGGSKRMILYNDIEPSEKVRIYELGSGAQYAAGDPLHPSYRLGDVKIPILDNQEPLLVEATHFVTCVREGITPLTDGVFGLDIVRVLDACSRALKNGTGVATL